MAYSQSETSGILDAFISPFTKAERILRRVLSNTGERTDTVLSKQREERDDER